MENIKGELVPQYLQNGYTYGIIKTERDTVVPFMLKKGNFSLLTSFPDDYHENLRQSGWREQAVVRHYCMQEGGRLYVSTDRTKLPADSPSIRIITKNEKVLSN